MSIHLYNRPILSQFNSFGDELDCTKVFIKGFESGSEEYGPLNENLISCYSLMFV